MVKLNEGGNYLKTADTKQGDVIKFLNEGVWAENSKYTYPDGNPRMDFIMRVEHGGAEKKFRVNKTNRDLLVEAWGNDTADWINKTAKVELIKSMIAGKLQNMIVLHPEGMTKSPVDDSIAWDE